MNGSAIGKMVRSCREDYAITPERLCELASVPLPRIHEIEKGAVPTIGELVALASALGVDPAALRRGNPASDPKRSAARFRSSFGGLALESADVRLLAKGAEVGRICGFLGRLLAEPPSPVATARSVVPIRSGSPPWQQGYDLGQKARIRLASTRAAIPSIQGLLESLGVHVAMVPFKSTEIEAASLYEADASPVILLNSNSSRTADPLPRRAALAHELCHLLHDGGERDLMTAVSRPEDHVEYEQRANGFAPSFIAPGAWVAPESKEPGALVLQVGYVWGFSYEGAVWHTKNLKLITPEKAQALLDDRKPILADGFELPAPRLLPNEGSDIEIGSLARGLLSDRVVRSLADGLISRGRAREILTLQ
ncbi:MAG TPA: XRE family transcriptional regulator [Polyangiaceae bacterium]|jgi:Zn-dependent peptidase ImmA (M78 family)/transcriptional regulator with XRE-family HTH domain